MPQMAPLNWLMILIFILTFFMVMNSMIYFTLNIKLSNKLTQSQMKKFYWKW
uniref:ATP synthase complex subunit 8 n=1 Tax=Tenebrionoidea sp. 24 KM-2017 TaxID=2219480 RepID=A0A346RJF6_9CUCU|nr:ATP synthase F0 subunit 8 [Tenebrionoidea sp. 24 KM-2017]